MQLAARWTIVPLLGAAGAVAFFAITSRTAFLEEVVEPADDREVSYVPISGLPLAAIVDEHDGDLDGWTLVPPADTGTCLPFLAGLTARPTWSLQLVRAAGGCMGTSYLDRFEVQSDGAVLWQRPGLAERRLQLTEAQLEQVRRLDRLDCIRTMPVGYGELYFEIGVGVYDGAKYAGRGAHISHASAMGAMVERVFDDAIASWVDHRIGELGAIDLRLAATDLPYAERRSTKVYDVHLVDRALTVAVGDRVLDTRVLSPIELVDTVDWVIASTARGAPDDPDLLAASGRLSVGGRTHRIAVWRHQGAERHPAETLLRTVYNAPSYDGDLP